MAFLKTQPEELDLVKQAAKRVAHRTHSKFVLKQELLETIADDKDTSSVQSGADEKTVRFG
jgi:hypothetical protein